METNLYCCSRTGRTISEKIMEDGNVTSSKDERLVASTLSSLYSEHPAKLTTNGHDLDNEASMSHDSQCGPNADTSHDDKFRKRINPLRIHLGKRPFVDNSLQYFNPSKKKKISAIKSVDTNPTPQRVPKLIPKRASGQFHNVSSQADNCVSSEQDPPVPRLVPKSQIHNYKKGKVQKSPIKEYAQSLGLQPMVKFKCRKCCSMSFKTLAMLKEHQRICRAQCAEPAVSPEDTSAPDTTNQSGPSRVTRKVYLCSACGTYYENWNLFLHMREVHNRHICLFCLGMFSKAEKLSLHLINKHNVEEFNYDSKEEFFNVYNGTLYLMCCECDEICSEKDDIFNHDCNNVKPKPVPVLVSKNSVKHTKNETVNLPTKPKQVYKKDVDDTKLITSTANTNNCVNEVLDSHEIKKKYANLENSVTSSKDSNTIDSELEYNSLNTRPAYNEQPVTDAERSNNKKQNGDDSIEHSDRSNSPVTDRSPSPCIEKVTKHNEPVSIPVEKEVGIKLKLSLNNANSPVIINSTVDPSIGQQKASKPPPRVRRPPKRYEKDKKTVQVVPPRTPTIKMTICDKADSSFVKTTFYENNQETTLETLLNNNLESKISESSVKTTIYDNKEEDLNTLNRVPKLTVRVPKELLDKDSSSEYSSDSDISDKLTVDENISNEQNTTIKEGVSNSQEVQSENFSSINEATEVEGEGAEAEKVQISNELVDVENIDNTTEANAKNTEQQEQEKETESQPIVPQEPEIPVTQLTLDKPLDKYPLKDLLKVFLGSTMINCIYCNHARKIAVNCAQLSLHMVAQHRFAATVDSITAEELMPETITAKMKTDAVEHVSVFINLDSYDSVDKCENIQYDHLFECFQCYFKTGLHKDLCFHNRKMHQKSILLCVMCKSNFYSYSELLCHLCPGTYDPDFVNRFRCCFCNVDTIPSSFRLMVHLRKIHHTCDVCLEFCHTQVRLSNHVWKHKLNHLCFRCGIAYRNKLDINNHLFWKHGTESVLCKRCLQKKWPHVYHFCAPPPVFVCDECNLQFTKAVYLKVHKRLHLQEFPHVCTEEGCTEKYVSKKLLAKHEYEHRRKLLLEDIIEKPIITGGITIDETKEAIPVIDLVDDKVKEEAGPSESKGESEETPKKNKKKKQKDTDALLLDVNLPALDLSESDSDESEDDAGTTTKVEKQEDILEDKKVDENKPDLDITPAEDAPSTDTETKKDSNFDEKPDEQQVLDIWDNFKKYQAKVEKKKEKTPPLVPIKKHVCESDHDYCLIPNDLNGVEDTFSYDKKKIKKSPKKRRGGLSSSSSSSSDSDSSCSCGSNCSCSSSGSSSSSSSDSDSSDESGTEKKKNKLTRKSLKNRRLSNGSNVDVMGMSETPILIPEKTEPPIPETDLETEESETDEEFYDEQPQIIGDKLNAEKRNLMLLPSTAPSDGGSVSGEASRPATPDKPPTDPMPKQNTPLKEVDTKEKSSSSKKKNKKRKKSKKSKKRVPIKINIPKDVISQSNIESPHTPLVSTLVPNKIKISLQSNTVHIPVPVTPITTPVNTSAMMPATSSASDNKRSSKRRRVPNKFYGYSSDEETPQATSALKPQQPPKLEWRKEDLPSPVTAKAKKDIPSSIVPQRLFNYTEPIRLTAPIPDPEPPRILMNYESMDSSNSDSSNEGALEIYQPQKAAPPPPSYLNSGTSSLPYAFQRPAFRQAREGESVYCYCRCPYDEVSEMIACDAEGCPIEWFHFECVGIMVPPKGKWYCPECRKNQNLSGYR